MENSFPISFSKCAARIHLIGQLSDQSNFTCFYSPKCPLSNGENRSSLSCSVRQLFKKHQSLLYFENDISNIDSQEVDASSSNNSFANDICKKADTTSYEGQNTVFHHSSIFSPKHRNKAAHNGSYSHLWKICFL